MIRQIHHWAALLFTCSILVHMCRVFFTGAFRKPRELNWVIGTLLSLLAVAEGFAGYSLPDDLLSGTGLRIAEGLMQSIPVIGSWLAFAVFDGPFPGDAIIPRLFTVHVLLLPALIVGLVAAHLILVVVQKHTQYPGPGHTNANVVGFRLMPVYLAKAGGFFFMVFGATALIAALVTINPIWMYGPYEPSAASAGSQPDWYMGFAEGALRLMPSWEFTALGHTLSLNVLVPGVLLIPVLYGIAMVYPFLERWVIGDQGEQHVLDRPRDAATRTGLGVMALTFYLVLFIAGADDIIADRLHLSFEDLVLTFRVLLLVAPPAAFEVTKRVCLGLQRRDRELVLHGRETGRLVRQGHGRFFEAHEPLDRYQRWPLVSRAARPPGDGARKPDLVEPTTCGAGCRPGWPGFTSATGSTLPPRQRWNGRARRACRFRCPGATRAGTVPCTGEPTSGRAPTPTRGTAGSRAARAGRRRGSAGGTGQRRPTSVAASGSAGVFGQPSPRARARSRQGRCSGRAAAYRSSSMTWSRRCTRALSAAQCASSSKARWR